MVNLFKCVAFQDGFTVVDENGTQFGLCCRVHGGFDDLYDGDDGAIVLWNGGVPGWLHGS